MRRGHSAAAVGDTPGPEGFVAVSPEAQMMLHDVRRLRRWLHLRCIVVCVDGVIFCGLVGCIISFAAGFARLAVRACSRLEKLQIREWIRSQPDGCVSINYVVEESKRGGFAGISLHKSSLRQARVFSVDSSNCRIVEALAESLHSFASKYFFKSLPLQPKTGLQI